ncbi:MBL fold metallo-hydrolase RNA specificity domain-containing protein [Aromatoleum aromaticum]|uniref:MBL fold metallo-hydrolase RNA specificity domain-containing protein n=1 Tax=Aromatoleum aromaticum TaxID=551760 RepID=UPI001459AA54|nr:MBL fold metallo-hydrolase [Aromatoleum aromaticum]NMG55812.1 MBL fold metallo-hydrolase [Aromatoleum aromaticum]
MDLTFFGAAGEVTGSCARVHHAGGMFLVDCGMFQGGRDATRKNLQALDFDLREVDFVILTHAHLDHSGLVPRLVSLGYRGKIYATAATVDLLGVMLLDSAHIQEKEAEWAVRNNRRKNVRHGWSTAPLYTVNQALESLASLHKVAYDEEIVPHSAVRCRFRDAGHILGSAIIEIDVETAGTSRRLVFSGDLGRPMRPVLRDPVKILRADYLCIESTYGNRSHRPIEATESELVHVLRDTLEQRRGNVIIPAFAVGRTQEVIFVLADLVRAGKIPRLEVVVDSPMASAVTKLTLQYDELWDEETRSLLVWIRAHPERISVRFVQDVEDSIALNAQASGLVIISASGMCEAGRIRHHLKYNVGRSECSIVICGFQAAGTLGRRLVDGARTITLFGESIAVRAQVHTIGGLSAHADQSGLLEWLGHIEEAPRRTFVVHGEQEASSAFADALGSRLHWAGITIPSTGQTYALD